MLTYIFYLGEEMDFLELLKSFGLDMKSVAKALGIDEATLNNMDKEVLLHLLTSQASINWWYSPHLFCSNQSDKTQAAMKLFETVAFSEAQVKKRRIVIKFALLDITLQDGQRRRPDLDLKEYFKSRQVLNKLVTVSVFQRQNVVSSIQV